MHKAIRDRLVVPAKWKELVSNSEIAPLADLDMELECDRAEIGSDSLTR